MENPFELILDKLNTIENLLRTAIKKDNGTIVVTEVFNLNKAANTLACPNRLSIKKRLKEIFHTSNRVSGCILNVVN